MSEQKKTEEQPVRFEPPWSDNTNRIDVNLIAMLLWQALLTGTAVAVSHLGWYLPDASAAEMGLQYGLIAFGFLCTAMVMFHVGGVRDSLAMRAEFSKENQIDKWMRSQHRLQQRRSNKQSYWNQQGQHGQQGQQGQHGNPYGEQTFGYIPEGHSNGPSKED